MPPAALIAAAAAGGGGSGFFGSKKTAGTDAGNPLNLNAIDGARAQSELGKFLNYSADSNVTGTGSSDYATGQVQNNPMLGQLFGKGGTLDQTVQQESDLANRGFSLQPEDYEAYGQGSDNIARQFGAAGGSLAQALSNRGLSNSGVAGQAYSGLQGSQLEQLGQMQQQIAQQRMQTNMQRLGQMQNFLSNMGGQAQGAIQGQWGRNMSGEQQNFNEAQAKNNAAYQRLSGMAGQANENMQQRAQTQTTPGWAAGLSGAFGGATLGSTAMAGNSGIFGGQKTPAKTPDQGTNPSGGVGGTGFGP